MRIVRRRQSLQGFPDGVAEIAALHEKPKLGARFPIYN
jgi:hypothetical protein